MSQLNTSLLMQLTIRPWFCLTSPLTAHTRESLQSVNLWGGRSCYIFEPFLRLIVANVADEQTVLQDTRRSPEQQQPSKTEFVIANA